MLYRILKYHNNCRMQNRLNLSRTRRIRAIVAKNVNFIIIQIWKHLVDLQANVTHLP